MALSPAEQAELQALESELGGSPAPEVPSVGAFEGLKRGLNYAGQRASRGIADTASWLGSDYVGRPLKNWAMSKGLVPSDEQLAAAKKASEEAGGWGTAGTIAGDIGTQMLPGAMASRAMQVGGRVAPLLGEIAANTGISTAFAPDAEKVDAAKSGAIGAVGGRVLAKALGGPLRNQMTADAKLLTDAGINLPPGQMIKGTGASALKRTLASMESGLSKIPLVGAPVKYRMGQAIEDYNKQQLNDILEPFGKTVTAGGRKGIQEARDAMEGALAEAAPNLYVPANAGIDIVDTFLSRIKSKDASINDRVLKTIRDVIELEITPKVAGGADVDGQVAYALGKKFDWYAKDYSSKSSPDTAKLERAFKQLRDEWYNAFEVKAGADPVYKEIVKDLQKAKRRWYNFRDASEKTTEGFFTPAQVIDANKGTAPDRITEAASHIMPRTAPDSNIGMETVMRKATTPGGVAGLASMAALSTPAWLAALAPYVAGSALGYTKTAGRYMQHGATPAVNKVASLLRKPGASKLTPEELEFAMQLVSGQGLRALANNRQQED